MAVAPILRNVGADGLLVSFADTLTEPANRAAIVFRAAVEAQGWTGVEETSSTLVSTYLRFTPEADPDRLEADVRALMEARDWTQEDWPAGRRHHKIPTLFGTELAPQLRETAELVGLTEPEAIKALCAAELRVIGLGFAPGQPYLGELPEAWNIPRQQGLTPKVPTGALVCAIRQLVIFATSAPTGWRHVGQTKAPLFVMERAEPVLLRPGDVVSFRAVSENTFVSLDAEDGGVETVPL